MGSLTLKPFNVCLFELGMVAIKSDPSIACSPDVLPEKVGYSSTEPPLASIEIKTTVAASILYISISHSSGEIENCVVGDSLFVQTIPKVHSGQLLQQALVLGIDFVIYVSASETSIIFICVIYIPTELRSQCPSVLRSLAGSLVRWADTNDSIPNDIDSDVKRTLTERLPFWRLVNSYVHSHGSFPPLKLFKHCSASFYSITKGGVDVSTQYRAVLRSPACVLPVVPL